jgi:hypothetical protein
MSRYREEALTYILSSGQVEKRAHIDAAETGTRDIADDDTCPVHACDDDGAGFDGAVGDDLSPPSGDPLTKHVEAILAAVSLHLQQLARDGVNADVIQGVVNDILRYVSNRRKACNAMKRGERGGGTRDEERVRERPVDDEATQGLLGARRKTSGEAEDYRLGEYM